MILKTAKVTGVLFFLLFLSLTLLAQSGDEFLRNDQFQEAVDTYSAAFKRGNAEISDYYKRGIAYLHLSEYRKAINDFNHYAENFDDFEVYVHRGIAYQLKGERDSARADFAGITEYLTGLESWKPANTAAWQMYIYGKGNQPLIQQGLEWVEMSRKLRETYFNQDTYAALLYLNGDNEKAMEWANEAMEIAQHDGLDYSQTEALIKSIRTEPEMEEDAGKPAKPDKIESTSDILFYEFIEKADQAVEDKKYYQALTLYEEANRLKPEESYPMLKIKELEGIIENDEVDEETIMAGEPEEVTSEEETGDEEGDMSEDRLYLDAINEADAAYEAKAYKKAISAYEDALAVKPHEPYPKYRIRDIEALLGGVKDDKAAVKPPAPPEKETIEDEPSTTGRTAIYHTVQPGNTLYRISVTHGISVDQIKKWNRLSSNSISVGQKLIVGYESENYRIGRDKPSPAPSQDSKTGKQPVIHVVVPANTLYNISKTYGVTVDQIKRWNNLTSNTISVGQRLVVGYE